MAKGDYKNKGNGGKKDAVVPTQYKTLEELHKEFEQRKRDLDRLEKAIRVTEAIENQTDEEDNSLKLPETEDDLRAEAAKLIERADKLREAKKAANRRRMMVRFPDGPNKYWKIIGDNGVVYYTKSYDLVLSYYGRWIPQEFGWFKDGERVRDLTVEEMAMLG